MKIFVHAKPSSKIPRLEVIDSEHFMVAVKEPPKENKANIAIMEALAEHFNISLARVRIVSGLTSRSKVFEIERG